MVFTPSQEELIRVAHEKAAEKALKFIEAQSAWHESLEQSQVKHEQLYSGFIETLIKRFPFFTDDVGGIPMQLLLSELAKGFNEQELSKIRTFLVQRGKMKKTSFIIYTSQDGVERIRNIGPK